MKIITFQGGLGNQLFEYTFFLWLKEKFPNETIYGYYPLKGLSGHSGLEINKYFDVQLPTSKWYTNILAKFLKGYRRLVPNTKLIKTINNFSYKGILYEDYWQDIRYMPLNNHVLFKNIVLDGHNRIIKELIDNSEAVSLHVRRGDYTIPKYHQIYGDICTREYYHKAIEEIKRKVRNPQFFVFSDDMVWVKTYLDLPDNTVYVEKNKGEKSYIDLYLMSKCKHNIIANSTFSWWAAYLNSNTEKIVIMPNRWFKSTFKEPNIFLPQWIKM